jgi:hypothetical protein
MTFPFSFLSFHACKKKPKMEALHILMSTPEKIPALKYGGISRVIWSLGKELTRMGHRITYLVEKGSVCDFAEVLPRDSNIPLAKQIPEDVDLVIHNFPFRKRFPNPT